MTAGTAGDSGTDADENSRPIVYDLAPDCTADDVDVGDHYHAVVNGVVAYGVSSTSRTTSPDSSTSRI